LENQRKRVFERLVFGSLFQYLSSIFSQEFFFVVSFPNTLFSHLSYHLYPIYMILFLVRKLVCGLLRPPSVVILFALCYPSCVEVIVEEFEFVGNPPKCRGDCGWFDFVPIPLVRGDCIGFVPISLLRGCSCVA